MPGRRVPGVWRPTDMDWYPCRVVVGISYVGFGVDGLSPLGGTIRGGMTFGGLRLPKGPNLVT